MNHTLPWPQRLHVQLERRHEAVVRDTGVARSLDHSGSLHGRDGIHLVVERVCLVICAYQRQRLRLAELAQRLDPQVPVE